MSNESFLSASDIPSITPDIQKYEYDDTIDTILNKKSNSNPGTLRSDSSSTITNGDTKSTLSQLPQKTQSLNENGENISNIHKTGKKFYSIRSTKASRAREELNKRKERQSQVTSTPFLRGQLYSVPTLKIPIRKVPSCSTIKSLPEIVKKTKPSPKANLSTTPESETRKPCSKTESTPEPAMNKIESPSKLHMSPTLIESTKNDVTSPKSLLSPTLEPMIPSSIKVRSPPTTDPTRLQTKSKKNSLVERNQDFPSVESNEPDMLKIPIIKTPDFRNVVKAKFKTMNNKLGGPSAVTEKIQQDQGDCNELINKYKRELSFRQRVMTSTRTKQVEKNVKENRPKYEKKAPEHLSRNKEIEQRKPFNKEIINGSLLNKNKGVGNYSPENIGDNQLTPQRTKEDKNQNLNTSDRLLSKRRIYKLPMPSKQPKESELSEKSIHAEIEIESEKPVNEAEVKLDVAVETPGDFSIATIEKLKGELFTAYSENKKMEKQVQDLTEELGNKNVKLKIAESTVEHLKTQQQAQLMNLSKRVAEVDELMSTAVAEREMWKSKATLLEKDLKKQAEAKSQDNKKREPKEYVERINPGLGNSTEITHREERIHTADERRGERKQKTIIKILKTVKKVQLTPEMYDKISYHPPSS